MPPPGASILAGQSPACQHAQSTTTTASRSRSSLTQDEGEPARLRTPDSAVGGKRRRPGGATVLYGRSLRSTWHRRGVGGFAGKPDNSPTASQESIRRGAQPLTEPVFGATATDHSPQDGTRRHMRKPRSAAGGRCRLMGRGIWPMVILAVVAIVSLPPLPLHVLSRQSQRRSLLGALVAATSKKAGPRELTPRQLSSRLEAALVGQLSAILEAGPPQWPQTPPHGPGLPAAHWHHLHHHHRRHN